MASGTKRKNEEVAPVSTSAVKRSKIDHDGRSRRRQKARRIAQSSAGVPNGIKSEESTHSKRMEQEEANVKEEETAESRAAKAAKLERRAARKAEKTERKKAERKKAEREKVEREKVEREKAEREKAEREKAEREKAEREKAEMEKAENSIRQLTPRREDWALSAPSAGRSLPHDLVFSKDRNGNQLLLSANERELQLLSLQDSLVQRTHQAPNDRQIKCFASGGPISDLVHLAYDDQTVAKWNYTDGAMKNERKLRAEILAVAPHSAKGNNDRARLVCAAKRGSQYRILSQETLLHSTEQAIASMQVLDDGLYIVCLAPTALVIGKRRGNSMTEYVWVEVPLPSTASCFDARLSSSLGSNKRTSNKHTGVSVAVGFENGRIYLYSHLSSLFEQSTNLDSVPTPRIFHWHRQAVASVKFSRDGNYLISGGSETVLVIWQLDTGKQQYLPHLTAAIERVVVSPKGNQYALQMGDNSIMVLSTTELKPVAHFGGLQMIARNAYNGDTSALPRMNAVLHPHTPNRLLVAVPPTQPKAQGDDLARPFLQTFDVLNSRHVTRQALALNFVAENNVTAEGVTKTSTDVVHLAISHDGTQLATIDERLPSKKSLEYLAPDGPALDEEQRRRREVSLKIWQWDEEQSLWSLTARWPGPHGRANGETWGDGRVVDLVADPAENRFATVGEDSCVKIWKAKPSRRGDDPESLKGGKCECRVELRRSGSPLDESKPSDTSTGFLAFSHDGSLLAAAYPTDLNARGAAPIVQFIKTRTGKLYHTKPGMTGSHPIRGLAFLKQRYFVAVSPRAVYVWDIIDDALMYYAKLPETDLKSGMDLAVSTETYAISSGKTLQVWSPLSNDCFYKREFELGIERVLAAGKGYTILFEDATIRTLQPGRAVLKESKVENGDRSLILPSGPGLEDGEESEQAPAADLTTIVKRDGGLGGNAQEYERPVVNADRLAALLEPKEGGALPSVREMFWAVRDLLESKP